MIIPQGRGGWVTHNKFAPPIVSQLGDVLLGHGLIVQEDLVHKKIGEPLETNRLIIQKESILPEADCVPLVPKVIVQSASDNELLLIAVVLLLHMA